MAGSAYLLKHGAALSSTNNIAIRQFYNWTFARGNHGGESSTGAMTIGSSTAGAQGFPNPTLAGSLLWFCNMTANDSATPTYSFTMSDTQGNSYNSNQAISNAFAVGDNFSMSQNWTLATHALGPTDSVTGTWGSFGDYHSLIGIEFTGVASVLTPVSTGYAPSSGTTTDSLTAGTATGLTGYGLLIGVGVAGGSFAPCPDAGTGMTTLCTDWPFDLTFFPFMRCAYKTWSPGTSSAAATFTPNNGTSETYNINSIPLLST